MQINQWIGAIAVVCFLLPACSHSGQIETSYTISGNISGLPDNTVVELVPMAHHAEKAIAEAVVKDGRFTFEGSIEEPRCMQLMVKDSYGTVKFMLENVKTSIDGEATVSKAHDDTPLYHYNVKVSGSPLSARFDSLVAVRDTMNALRADFEKRYQEFFDARNEAYKQKDTKKVEELMQSETYKAMQKEDMEFFHMVENKYNRVILDNKDTYWGPLMLLELTSYLTPDQKATYEAFSKEAQESYYGKLVHEELYPAGSIGQAVKPFTVKSAEGEEVTLASLLKEKKYVLIDFWASWCGPCRKEIPNLKKLYGQYAEKGFQIVSISIDKKEEDWQKALKEEGLTWPNFCDEEVANLYKVKAVPTMYLVDAQGILVAQDLRGEALAEKLATLFAD